MLQLLPKVKCLEEKTGKFMLPWNFEILLPAVWREQLKDAAAMLMRDFESCCGIKPVCNGFETQKTAIRFVKKPMQDEAYELQINENGVLIAAAGHSGWIWGVQTLKQIARQSGAALPYLFIEDYPSIGDRGILHDVTRSRVPKMEYMKQLADFCSTYKINQLQLNMEHSFLFPQFHEVWRDDTPLTGNDIIELDEYCKKRAVELVPAIASFGHLYKVLRTKRYRHLSELEGADKEQFSFIERQLHHTLNPLNPESFELVKEMLTQYASLFSSSKFNICCDETFDLGQGKSRMEAERVGIARLYVDFLKKVCSHIQSMGKQPLYWGDVLLEHPDWIGELPKDGICLNWDYAKDISDTKIKKMQELGAKQYCCPGVHGWNHLMNRLDIAYGNISRMCRYAHEYDCLGVLNTDWGDYGHINHPIFSMPGFLYGAALSWDEGPMEEKELNYLISALEYGDQTGRIVELLRDISMEESTDWGTLVQYREAADIGVWVDRIKEIGKRFGSTEKMQKANKVLLEKKEELSVIIGQLDIAKKISMSPYLLMIDGQMIFNQIGAVVLAHDFNVGEENAPDCKKTAAALECWFYEYKECWRSISRESELAQLQKCIFWYADLLRDWGMKKI